MIEKKLQKSDPLAVLQQVGISWAFVWGREYERAIEQAERVLVLEPEAAEPFAILWVSYDLKGVEREAFEAFIAQRERSDRAVGEDTKLLQTLRERFERSGWKGVQEWQLENLLKQPVKLPHQMAGLYTRLGEKDKALEWLEKLWELPLWGCEAAPSSPVWDPLRDDPRFEQLLRKLNLPEEAIQRHLDMTPD